MKQQRYMPNQMNHMQPQEAEQSRLDLEIRLEALVGSPIRVLTDMIPPEEMDSPSSEYGLAAEGFGFLDGTRLEGIPFLVEGVLEDFIFDRNEIVLNLSPRPFDDKDSVQLFRGRRAVIYGGSAIICLEITSPHFIELIPTRWAAYLGDLRSPNYQFEFDFVDPQVPALTLPLY